MDSFKWPSRTIEKFLRIYTQYPCLWDFSHQNYVSKPQRQLALEEILAEMNIPGLDMNTLKRKIHSIRNTYTNERRKIEKSKQGTVHEVYQPRIRWYYMADKFLGGVAVTRKKLAAANSLLVAMASRTPTAPGYPGLHHATYKPKECRPAEVSISTIEKDSRRVRSRTEMQCKPSDPMANFNGTPAASVDVTYMAETPSPSFPEVTWKEEPVEILDDDGIEKIIEEGLGAGEHTADAALFAQPQGDELEAFSRSVLLQMRRLPEEYNIDLMSEIQRLISHKRREYLYSQAKYGTSQNSLSRQT